MKWPFPKKNALLAILLLVASATSFAASADDELVTLARSSRKPVIADFGLGFCMQCKQQRATLDEIKKAFGDKVVIRMVDVGKETGLLDRYKIEMIPTLVFFDSSGKVTLSKLGPLGFKEIRDQLSRMGVKP